MKNIILSFLLVTAFTCQKIKSERGYPYLYRCENDEVICYIQNDAIGYGGVGGVFCKFKDERKN